MPSQVMLNEPIFKSIVLGLSIGDRFVILACVVLIGLKYHRVTDRQVAGRTDMSTIHNYIAPGASVCQ